MSKTPMMVKYLGLTEMGLSFSKDSHPITLYLGDKTCKLQTLCLAGNQISIKGALAISQGLCLNKSIKVLDLSRNFVGPKGCALLAEAMSGGHLKSVDLSYNTIGDEGAKALS